jgi:hypothetical protein
MLANDLFHLKLRIELMPTSTAVVNRDIRPFDEEEVKRAIERAKANKSP